MILVDFRDQPHAFLTRTRLSPPPRRIGTVQDCAQSLLHYQMAARETIADLHSEGRGGIPRSIDGTRLTEYFVGGRRPISDSNSEVVDLLEAAADVGDIISIRKMGMWHQHGDRYVLRCSGWFH